MIRRPNLKRFLAVAVFCAGLPIGAEAEYVPVPRQVLKVLTPTQGQVFAQNSTLTLSWDAGALELRAVAYISISQDGEFKNRISLPPLFYPAKSHTYYLEHADRYHADRYHDDRYDVKDGKGGPVLATLRPGEKTEITLTAVLFTPEFEGDVAPGPFDPDKPLGPYDELTSDGARFTVLPYGSHKTRQTIRGKVGVRMQARILGLSGVTTLKGQLPRGLKYHRAVRQLAGRPTRIGRHTVFFFDRNDTQTIATIIVRKSPPRR